MNEDISEGCSIHSKPSFISGVYIEFNAYLLNDTLLSNKMDIVVDIATQLMKLDGISNIEATCISLKVEKWFKSTMRGW